MLCSADHLLKESMRFNIRIGLTLTNLIYETLTVHKSRIYFKSKTRVYKCYLALSTCDNVFIHCKINNWFFHSFLLKLGKTSSGGVGEDRLKKFLGKSDVGWSNTWWDWNVLLRARNALNKVAHAPVVLVPVLKKIHLLCMQLNDGC